MKCIDFKKYILTELNSEQKEHIKTCSRCIKIWENQVFDRLIINIPFDPELEEKVDFSEKPPTGSFITEEFWKDVEEHFSERAGILKKVDSYLTERFKSNPVMLKKLRFVALKISNDITEVPRDFDQRFSSALGYFTDHQAENLKEDDLIEKMKKQINDRSKS